MSIIYYKYREIGEHANDILKNKRCFLSGLSRLNDPYQAYMESSSFDNPGTTLNGNANDRYNLFLESRDTSFPAIYKILSLCKSWDNKKLWSDYAKDFSGLAIGVFLPSLESKYLMDVSYVEKHSKFQEPLSEEDILKCYSEKLQKWSFEQETRVIHPIACPNDDIEYLEGIKIAEVVFGYNSLKNDIQLIMEILRYDNVKFFKLVNDAVNNSISREEIFIDNYL